MTTAIVQYPADFSFEISLAPIPEGQLASHRPAEKRGKEPIELAVLLQLVHIYDAIKVLCFRLAAAALSSASY